MSYKYSLRWMLAAHISRLVVAGLIPLVTLPYVTRTLGPSGLGLYQFITAFVANFIILGNMGIPTFGQRDAASVRHNSQQIQKKASHLFALGLVSSVFIYFVLLVFATFSSHMRPNLGLISLIGLSIPATALSAEWLLMALDDFVFVSIRSAGLQLLATLCVFIFVKSASDVFLYATFLFAPQCLASILNWSKIKRHLSFDVLTSQDFLNTFKNALPFLASTLAISFYTNMDTVYLGFFYTNNEVGQYSLAKRLLLAGIALSTSLGSLLISRLANIYVLSDLQKFTDLIKLSIQFLLLIVLPASLGFAFLAPELALALGGGYYPDAVLAIYILAPCMFFVGLAHVALNQILIAKGQEKKAFLIWITGGFVSIVIGLTLVPKFGISGAAATCTLSELMVTVIALYCVRNTLKLAVSGKDCLLAVSASGLMVLAIVFSRSVFDSLPLILRTFALVVVGVLSFNSVGWPIYAKLRRTQQKLPKT